MPYTERIIVFTRYPKPGAAKSRLIPAIGPEAAAELHRRMTEHVLQKLKPLKSESGISFEIRYDCESEKLMRLWLGPDLSYRPQGTGGLGERMFRAFSEAFRDGIERCVLVGTDVPGLSAGTVGRALDALAHSDLVLGPANDGGYYLIGLRRPVEELFRRIPWSTPEVLERTLEVAEKLGLSTTLVNALDDVDRPEDVSVWLNQVPEAVTGGSAPNYDMSPGDGVKRFFPLSVSPRIPPSDKNSDSPPSVRGARGGGKSAKDKNGAFSEHLHNTKPLISVIIPTLNEQSHIGPTLHSIGRFPGVEIIVSDGGSEDKTADLASSFGAIVIVGARGRGRQMNTAAERALGEILLFVHADTLLPQSWREHVMRVLEQPGVSAGAFQFRIATSGRSFRIIEKLANFRSRQLQMPYGDQGIFLRAGLFRQVGGFPDIPIMEDFEFLRRVKRCGRIGIAPAAAVTSGRRWREVGVWRTTVINQMILAGYFLGISLPTLAKLYNGEGD